LGTLASCSTSGCDLIGKKNEDHMIYSGLLIINELTSLQCFATKLFLYQHHEGSSNSYVAIKQVRITQHVSVRIIVFSKINSISTYTRNPVKISSAFDGMSEWMV
jgi:hypothetical protein